tara:strand:+ start:232 stop:360 length:129 start_codon:yes stop_codon:yes gene_type:complete
MSLSRSAKAALRQAGTEGPTLLRSAQSTSGYMNVFVNSRTNN